MSPYDIGAILCGILAGTGVLGILGIFALYQLEDWLREGGRR